MDTVTDEKVFLRINSPQSLDFTMMVHQSCCEEIHVLNSITAAATQIQTHQLCVFSQGLQRRSKVLKHVVEGAFTANKTVES